MCTVVLCVDLMYSVMVDSNTHTTYVRMLYLTVYYSGNTYTIEQPYSTL